MDVLANPFVLLLASTVIAIIGGILTKGWDAFMSRWRQQGTQGEHLAGVMARVAQLEDDRGKIAQALDRITRLEEFRGHTAPQLEEAAATARTVVAFGEQMKSVFKRIDAMNEEMTSMGEAVRELPQVMMQVLPKAVKEELRSMVRAPQQGR